MSTAGRRETASLPFQRTPKPLEGARAPRFISALPKIFTRQREATQALEWMGTEQPVCVPWRWESRAARAHWRAAVLANTVGNPVIWEQTMQLLTLKPQFPREVAFYQAHVRSDGLGRRLCISWENTGMLSTLCSFFSFSFPK